MESLNEIAKVSYEYIETYVENIGNMTHRLLQSNHDIGARLAIEIWSTIADLEAQRTFENQAHHGIIKSCFEQILQILFFALNKANQNTIDESLDEYLDSDCSPAAGTALEAIAKVMQDAILQPVFDFLQPKINS